jgi:predicted Fe-Mo cluster-binding NifX family protein
MANHEDAEITEIIVVINKAGENYMDEAVEKLKAAGVEIFSTDEENDVVEGAVESVLLTEIEKIPGVSYVRSVETYIADYPPGDPRDKDGAEADDE